MYHITEVFFLFLREQIFRVVTIPTMPQVMMVAIGYFIMALIVVLQDVEYQQENLAVLQQEVNTDY